MRISRFSKTFYTKVTIYLHLLLHKIVSKAQYNQSYLSSTWVSKKLSEVSDPENVKTFSISIMQYGITYTVEDTIHIVSMQYHAQCLF